MNEQLKAYRDSLSEQEKKELLQQAQAQRKLNAELAEANKHLYKTSYMDESYWAELAANYKIRMPSKIVPASAAIIRKYLKKAGVEMEVFKEHYTSVKYFLDNNPTWSAYATVGIILELK